MGAVPRQTQGSGFSWMNNQPQAQPQAQPAQTLNQQYPYKGGLKWGDMTKQLAYLAQPGALSGLNFMNQIQPMQQNLTMGAFNALNPANRQGRVDGFRRQAQQGAMDTVNEQAGTFGLLDARLLDALRAGAMNQATQSGNEYMRQQYSPEMDVQSALMGAQLSDPAVLAPLLNWYTNLIQQGDNVQTQKNAQKGGGMLGGLAGLAGMAGGLGWSPF